MEITFARVLLIGLQAFTGCDTIRAFGGRGKLGALKCLKLNDYYQKAFKKLGESWDVSPDLFEKLEDFVCRMYAPSSTTCQDHGVRKKLWSGQ